jgi:hypothetical protein
MMADLIEPIETIVWQEGSAERAEQIEHCQKWRRCTYLSLSDEDLRDRMDLVQQQCLPDVYQINAAHACQER